MSGSTLPLGGNALPPDPAGGRAVRLTLDAWPLTPIHVGDGSSLSPESFLLKDDTLCRFEPARVVASMTAAERQNYMNALDRGDLGAAQKLLRRAVLDAAIVERVAVSAASLHELREAIENPDRRRGEVHPFIRTGGRPFIPGSSIKGALRTALASHWLPGDVSPQGLTHEWAMQKALALTSAHDTDRDPLRFVSVADVMLPEGTTLIDRPQMMKRTHDGQLDPTQVQIHVERLRCSADFGKTTKLRLSITLRPDRCPEQRRIDRSTLLAAVNKFHWEIWEEERRRFFAKSPTAQAMDRLMESVKVGDSTLARKGPGATANFLLLRLGRFGHFESKSLARVRQGHVPQARANPVREAGQFGSTRTVIKALMQQPQQNGPLLPMGWLLACVVNTEEIGA
jgi:CRISPR-associated protein Csm5